MKFRGIRLAAIHVRRGASSRKRVKCLDCFGSIPGAAGEGKGGEGKGGEGE